MDDSELLAEFGRKRSGTAFGEIVRRYSNLVYSAALRQMRNADEAEELTQAVFVILSQKAGSLSPSTPLVGWLLTTTRFAAMNLRRAKIRRAHHERKAAVMEQQIEQLPASDSWKEVAPLLDAAMASLKSDQRNAVALRYFQGQPFAAVASRMGISEEAAKKRVIRGVEKLRKFFARRGVAVPAVGLTKTIADHAVHAAPVHLAASCTVANKASASLGEELLRIMLMGKLTWIASGIAAVVAIGGVAVVTLHAVQARLQSSIQPVANDATVPPAVNPQEAHSVTEHGIVRGPDGTPLAGVVVCNAARAYPVSIYSLPPGPTTVPIMSISNDGNVVQIVPWDLSKTAPAPSTTSYQGGHFHLNINHPPAMLVVNDDHGFAKVPAEDFNPGDTIQLQAWSRVEGKINLKDRSGIDSQIYLANCQDFQNPHACEVLEYSSAPIDADGHFVFPRVPPGPVWLYTKITTQEHEQFIGPSTFVRAAAGQTMSVSIGDHGRTVKGKFVFPAGSDPTTAWKDPQHFTNCLLHSPLPDTMPHPSDWLKMNPTERASYRDAWQQTPAAQNWNAALLPQSLAIRADGSFQFVGVKPGHYQLEMHVSETALEGESPDDVASLTTEVDVPTDEHDQPLDLGSLTVKVGTGLTH